MDAPALLSAAAGPVLLLALVVANAFFVLGEFSLITVERGLVERLAATDARARSVLQAMRRLTVQLSGAQLGITLTSLLVGFLAEPALAGLLEPPLGSVPLLTHGAAAALAVALALAISTVLQLVLGEQVPKGLAITHPLRSALLVATPLRAFCWACRPAIHVLNSLANAVVRRLGVEPSEEIAAARSIDELEVVIRESAGEGMLDRATGRLLVRAVRFRRKTAADALVPRVAMVALPRHASAADLIARSVSSRHERLPVYGRGRDDVVGVADVRDALRVAPDRRAAVRVEELMRPPLVVPHTADLHRVLARMRAAGQRTAVVIDEYGGTAGIMTAEDVLEEMAGEIEAQAPPGLAGASPGWLLPGTAPLDHVLEEVGLELPAGEYATVAGFLLHRLGDLPAAGDVVELDGGWSLRVASMDGHRIAWVAVQPPARP
jgi:magnesium and cobalt exporter, CNNM family